MSQWTSNIVQEIMERKFQFFAHICRTHNTTQVAAASIRFEIWGVVEPGQKYFDFSRQISEKFRFFQVISLKNLDFSRKISEKFRFLQAISLKKFHFSRHISQKFRFFRKF